MAAPGTPFSPSVAQLPAVSQDVAQSDPLTHDSLLRSASPAFKQDGTAARHSSSRGPSRANTPGQDQMSLTIHTAAQRGDLPAIMRLVDSGRATVHDRDDDNITPLHWAAINAQLATCRYLLDHGAEVDALGGDLIASPMQWAARNGHTYVLELLSSRGADPTIADSQGFNALHLTVHSSAVMPLVYMLQNPMLSSAEGYDSTDSQGHTALMWAAYQGDAISVDILLKHGCDVHKKDSVGLTAMHWAVVKGNRLCIRLLAEAKADLLAKEDSGKTPRDMAIELKSIGAYHKALADIGLEEDGRRKQRTFGSANDRTAKLAVMVMPFLALGIVFATFSSLSWYSALPLALAEFFGMHHVITKVILDPQEHDFVQRSNYFLAVVTASVLWVGWEWARKVAASTPGYASNNLMFALTYIICAWNLFRASVIQPGYSPLPSSALARRQTVYDLAQQGRLNGQTFCVSCMARKAIRSKHCKLCKRCVGRHDHHCPWIANCVGVQNHRQFLIFVGTLVLGIAQFIYLSTVYFSINAPPYAPIPDSAYETCHLPFAFLCTATTFDPFLFGVVCWAALQLSWTIVLLIAQSWQIMRQMTTLEVSNLGRYGFMGGKGGQSYSGQTSYLAQHSAQFRAQTGGGDSAQDRLQGIQSEAAQQDANDTECSARLGTTGGSHTHPHSHSKIGAVKRICSTSSGWLLSIVGLDLYTRGKAGEGLKRAHSAANPFDQGILSNCKDFWSKGQDLDLDYTQLYDLPASVDPGHCQVVPFLMSTASQSLPRAAQRGMHRGSIADDDDDQVHDTISASTAPSSGRKWNMWTSLNPNRGEYSLLPTTNSSSF